MLLALIWLPQVACAACRHVKIKQRRLAISCLILIIFEKAEEMPPSKEVPPGIVGFLIDFACRWCARQEVVEVLRSLMMTMLPAAAARCQQEVVEMETTHAKIHGKNVPWQNCFRHH